jgi:uncharacterized protein YjbI with pentapeptide repeats
MGARRLRVAVVSALALLVASVPALAAPASAVTCPVVAPDGTVALPTGGFPVLTGCDLTGARLDGADLTRVSLAGVNLTGASLRGARLAYFGSANLTGADLTDADLRNASAEAVNFSGATLTGAVLSGGDLRYSSISSAKLAGADLRGLVAGRVAGTPASVPAGWGVHGDLFVGPGVVITSLSVSDPAQVDLSGADLTGASLGGFQYYSSAFRGTTLTGADLTGSSFMSSDFTGAIGLPAAISSATTSWIGSTCPDGLSSDKHDGRSCLRERDRTAPTLALGGPSATMDQQTRLDLGLVESGSGIAMLRMLEWSAPVTTSHWTRHVVSDWSQVQSPLVFDQLTPDGRRSCVQVQVLDHAGNVSAWSRAHCVEAVYDDTASTDWTKAGSWGFRVANGWMEASATQTTRHGDWIASNMTMTAHRIGLAVMVCPTCGSVAVVVGRHRVGTFSLVSRTTARRLLLLPRWRVARKGVVRFVVTSRNGRIVRVDGFLVSVV